MAEKYSRILPLLFPDWYQYSCQLISLTQAQGLHSMVLITWLQTKYCRWHPRNISSIALKTLCLKIINYYSIAGISTSGTPWSYGSSWRWGFPELFLETGKTHSHSFLRRTSLITTNSHLLVHSNYLRVYSPNYQEHEMEEVNMYIYDLCVVCVFIPYSKVAHQCTSTEQTTVMCFLFCAKFGPMVTFHK